MNIKSTNHWRSFYLWFLIFTYIILLVVLFHPVQNDSMAVRMFISAENSGRFSFYWPDFEGHFAESRSRYVSYPAGESGHQFHIPFYRKPILLRLDPDSRKNRVTIHSITLQHAGKSVKLEAPQIGKHIATQHNLTWKQTEDGLILDLHGTDPQLILQGMAWPVWDLLEWFMISALAIALILLTRWLARLPTTTIMRISGVLAGFLVLLYWLGFFSADAGFYQAMLMIAGISLDLVLWLMVLLDNTEPDEWLRPNLATPMIALVLGAIFIPMVQTVNLNFFEALSHGVKSAWNKKPAANLNDKLEAARNAMEETFVRNFHYSNQLITLNAESKVDLLGFSPSTKAILGKDGWFFEGYGGRRVEGDEVRSFDNITDYMGLSPFSEKELKAWRDALEERYYWLKEQGIDYVFALAPTKALIYPEKLPARIYAMEQALDLPTRYSQLINYLKKNSVVPVVDLRTALLQAKHENKGYPLFYRTDFHWTYYGSFIAYQAIINEINEAYPGYRLKPAKLDEFRIGENPNWVHERFMAMVGLDPARHQDETYLTFFPKKGSPYADIDDFSQKGISDYSTLPEAKVRHFGKERLGVRELDNPAAKLPLVFVIGDSFIEKTLGYLSAHSKKLLNFRAVTNFPVAPYSSLHPSIVIQEVLNMYILQPPPSNPPEVKAARARALNTP